MKTRLFLFCAITAAATAAGAGIACEALAGRTIGGATISTAEPVAATPTLAAYCKVNALIEPKLNFELRLPLEWNRKLHYGGGGGYNGAIPPAVSTGVDARATRRSAVTRATRAAGWTHRSSLNDPHAAQLFGSLSVPTVTAAAHEIVRAHYRHRAKRAYFEGCSNGGREALMNVQRYPSLFDGVISRAPAYNWVGIMGAFNRTAKALAAPGGAMSPAKVATLSNAVLAACDALDGVADGVVSNPQACSFDPATLRCAGGADTGDTCLSDAQLAVVNSWTQPASFGGGRLPLQRLAAHRQRKRRRRVGRVGQRARRRCSSVPGHHGQVLPRQRPARQLAALRLRTATERRCSACRR